MGRNIGGVYTPSYPEILKEKIEFEMAKEKAAYDIRRDTIEDARAAEMFGLEKQRIQSQIDYNKAKTLKLGLDDPPKGKEKPPFSKTQLEAFGKLIASGYLKQAEKYGIKIGLLDEGSKIQKKDDGVIITGPEETLEITPDGILGLAGINSKKDMEKFNKERDHVFNIVKDILGDRNSERVSLTKEIEKRSEGEGGAAMEKLAEKKANETGRPVEDIFNADEYRAKRVAEIERKYETRLDIEVFKRKGLSEDIKAMAKDLYFTQAGRSKKVKINLPGEQPGSSVETPKTQVIRPPAYKANLESYLSTGG